MYIECPHCHTQYTAERCGLEVIPGLFFTISCALCGESFDGDLVTRGAVPASRLYQWTRGWFGTPGTAEEIQIQTRARP